MSEALNLEPVISVILPAWNERERIAGAIESLQQQTYTRWRATVVANGCTDDTAAIVRGFHSPQIEVLETEDRGTSVPKNAGYRRKKPTDEVFVFMDSDCTAKSNLLETVVTRIKKNYEGGKAGATPMDDDRLRARLFFAWDNLLHRLSMPIPGIDSGGGRFIFLKRELASKIEFPDGGIFDEGLAVMEDINLMQRMKKQGPCTFITPKESGVLTTARRFKEEGYLHCMIEDAVQGVKPRGKTRTRWQIPEKK